jgi:hypothetical protein
VVRTLQVARGGGVGGDGGEVEATCVEVEEGGGGHALVTRDERRVSHYSGIFSSGIIPSPADSESNKTESGISTVHPEYPSNQTHAKRTYRPVLSSLFFISIKDVDRLRGLLRTQKAEEALCALTDREALPP